ncbi:diaminohydroxyphosphoribosylaminopyrimidine deaminase/5-amino-6-(5-phosphoribosylamino)uracil reductase [Anoxybacillus voinovskiensis]|uniref:Riboflavin biosynthesis protein RibD n=1 Tax=Anoxybacteroides voinovskiense TaxID=230470 RepID=A0A840DJV4_9BACL|nr:bifunctional diaminohydroxyphosphoribosylaminopyrimidine deaminase/5-amino-6-(5-phosphoribosylamino)uracil reductase RibD [Anoxybacillus voinovskiensis]MBB4073090.1 diaminohydroxyphosphoribosylaminopyrimidine deaminase/5-amino-6-(5-phosphoribosylamino)uracil reductase [Anoxybacillus voinovskiensis]GGJ59568.1 riboflavin biosynthesis protein RibD [Anoxybacillus voinovskiensis]
MQHDERYMRLAFEIAKTGLGQTSPNPAVGAVVVKNGEIVGFGAHLKAGEPHAEVHAIRMAGDKAKGATVYVTLEPCSHFGKTPPCADLLVETGVQRVVIATTDPNPLVAGKGIEKLKQAGIDVTVGVLKEEADDLNRVFFHYITTKTPFVTMKFAASLDGKIATKTGESKWITSEEARQDVHRYRARHDAILVGVDTVIADDPSLTVRLPEGGKNPIRLILDTHLRTPLEANVVQDGAAETWIVVGSEVSRERIALYARPHVRIVSMPTPTIDIRELLNMLAGHKITSVFVEGGAKVHDSFIRAGAVQEIIAYFAPKIIGGSEAKTPVEGIGFAHMTDVLELTIKRVETIGRDIKIIAAPKR